MTSGQGFPQAAAKARTSSAVRSLEWSESSSARNRAALDRPRWSTAVGWGSWVLMPAFASDVTEVRARVTRLLQDYTKETRGDRRASPNLHRPVNGP
jgi:hypothetical protein